MHYFCIIFNSPKSIIKINVLVLVYTDKISYFVCSLFNIQNSIEQAGGGTTKHQEFFTLLPFKAWHVEQ